MQMSDNHQSKSQTYLIFYCKLKKGSSWTDTTNKMDIYWKCYLIFVQQFFQKYFAQLQNEDFAFNKST